MTERTDRVKLPGGFFYCYNDTCRENATCARRLAALPPLKGGVGPSMADGMRDVGSNPLTGFCAYYLSTSHARKWVARDEEKARTRGVKPPLGG